MQSRITTMQCIQCRVEFQEGNRVASISGSIMGDEHTDVYYFCPRCGVYTVAQWRDNFTGEETMDVSGPLPKEEGDEQVKVIQKCAQPWDKKCRCAAHCAYFRDTLD